MRTPVELLEREHELQVLAEAVECVRNGDSRFLLIEAGPGLGKTRLLAETRHAADQAGMRVLAARGGEMEREFAFGIVRQLFERPVAVLSEEKRHTLFAGAAGQAQPVFGPSIPGGAAAGDFAVLHGLYWLTAGVAGDGPLALLLDDLHWADPASLRFLVHLLTHIEGLAVLLVATCRPGEGDPTGLLSVMAGDPACTRIQPKPLSERATDALLAPMLAPGVEKGFLAACHAATRGNPLYLRELAGVLSAEGTAPTERNIARVTEVGVRAVARRVTLGLDRLPPEAVALAHAVAILDRHAWLPEAAAFAGLTVEETTRTVTLLEKVDLLEYAPAGESVRQESSADRIQFVHPLVRAAVYEAIDLGERIRGHRRAAALLERAGAGPEEIAVHLLPGVPAGEPHHAEILRQAAQAALQRGAPEAAHTLLRRGLAEEPRPQERMVLLRELCDVAEGADVEAAIGYLGQAFEQAAEPERTMLAFRLGVAYSHADRWEESVVVWSRALADTAPGEGGTRPIFGAALLAASLAGTGRQDHAALFDELRGLPPAADTVSRVLDCVLSLHETYRADRAAVPRARRGAFDGLLTAQAVGDGPLSFSWFTLLFADDDDVMVGLDDAIAHAHRSGSTRSAAVYRISRAMGWLWQGQLLCAEDEAREALLGLETARVDIFRDYALIVLADAAMERGAFNEATALVGEKGYSQAAPSVLSRFLADLTRARLLRRTDRAGEALDLLFDLGARYAAAGGVNPGVVPWRSEAARCLSLLGRGDEARVLADEELAPARQWGAPRALGRALLVRGMVGPREEALTWLTEAVEVLAPSPARLDHARALAALGAALRGSGRRGEARRCLADARDVADACGATRLAEKIRLEQSLSGAAPRPTKVTGPEALTVSERRTAELAAVGLANREIAQRLFVTVKTVETHLATAYRKLGISRRELLAGVPGLG